MSENPSRTLNSYWKCPGLKPVIASSWCIGIYIYERERVVLKRVKVYSFQTQTSKVNFLLIELNFVKLSQTTIFTKFIVKTRTYQDPPLLMKYFFSPKNINTKGGRALLPPKWGCSSPFIPSPPKLNRSQRPKFASLLTDTSCFGHFIPELLALKFLMRL